MEEQLNALALGAGARVAVCLHHASRPLRWSDLHRALGDDLASRGTLTKTLRRLVRAGLVAKDGDTYRLVHPTETLAALRAATDLTVAVADARLADAKRRRRELTVSPVPDEIPSGALRRA